MHGSSSVPQELQDIINKYGGKLKQTWGVPVEEIQRGIKNGVRKINVDTDNRLAITGAIRKVFAEKPEKFDPRDYLKPARDAMKKVVAERMTHSARPAMERITVQSRCPRWPRDTGSSRGPGNRGGGGSDADIVGYHDRPAGELGLDAGAAEIVVWVVAVEKEEVHRPAERRRCSAVHPLPPGRLACHAEDQSLRNGFTARTRPYRRSCWKSSEISSVRP